MDRGRFDDQVQRLARTPRRRLPGALAGLLGGTLFLARGEAEAGAGCKKLNRRCRKERQCCSGQCRRGRCRRGGRG